MICVYSFFFRFIILHAFKTLHSRERKTKTKQTKKKEKLIKQQEWFHKKICATRQAHDTASKKETSKNSPVCINVVLFHKQQVSNGL
jgi:hypothetical protein